MTKLNQLLAAKSAMRVVEDDEQRSATAPGRVKLQIGIAFFFVIGKERERDSDRKKKKRERGAETSQICGDNTEM